ncbi:MAG: phospho-N-acetylmuramoyl-pentapeptide-transferase [Firmicutes bacterium]|jgi:phospho-N-acetylmuramoyl-pentapeptide-transferase|nr:phospho-N-acetylmuramoyl-pentapeptide-transferase [Bacillota bacterium]
MMRVAYAAVAAFVIALLLGPATIGYLRRLKFGQTVRNDGPQTHLKKSGVPTMGGVLIIFAYFISTWLFALPDRRVSYALLVGIAYGIIGLLDDFIIVVAKRPLGLRARYKAGAQVIIALLLALYALTEPDLGPQLLVPFTGQFIQLPPGLFIPLVVCVLLGAANGVNLTDGLDGLAAGSMVAAAAAYGVIAASLGQTELAVLAGAVTGACLGFSWFNTHPAQVFMGDTGSLSLGGVLGSLAVLTQTELFLPLVGGIFVIETLSVIIQVAYFRLTKGRRIFRMSPLHHHFELKGWAEPKVVTRFWILALMFALLGLFALPGAKVLVFLPS